MTLVISFSVFAFLLGMLSPFESAAAEGEKEEEEEEEEEEKEEEEQEEKPSNHSRVDREKRKGYIIVLSHIINRKKCHTKTILLKSCFHSSKKT